MKINSLNQTTFCSEKAKALTGLEKKVRIALGVQDNMPKRAFNKFVQQMTGNEVHPARIKNKASFFTTSSDCLDEYKNWDV